MSNRTILTETQIENLLAEFPKLPNEYIEYLKTKGWGEADNGRMIYEGPIQPKDIYGKGYSGPAILLLGDDFQGYCFGYDPVQEVFGEISDFGKWEPWSKLRSFSDYVKPCEEE